jgi:subfamily B ATP-binding cassette protein MsbA
MTILKKDHLSSWPLMRRMLVTYIKPRWKKIALAMILMTLASSMTAAQAYLLKPIIDKVFTNHMGNYLLPIAIALIIVFVMRGIATWGHTVMMAYVGQDIVGTIQSQIFHHLIRQDISYFQTYSAGRLSSLLVSDVALMRMVMADTLTNFGKNFLTLVFLVGVMFHQDWKLSLLAFVVFPPAGFIVSKIGKKLRRVAYSAQEERGFLSGLLNQSFMGIRQVKAYNAEEHEDRRVEGTLTRINKLSNKAARVSSLSSPFSELLSGCAIALIICFGGAQVISGHSTTGKFISFIAAFIMAYDPLKRLANLNANLQMGLASTSRVFEALDTPPQIVSAPDAPKLIVNKPSIVFENVTFRYPDGTLALDNISFEARAGQKTALVGPSGSGKTTCLQLLLRYFDLESGRILVDGQDISQVDIASLRDHLGFVSQDVFIFDDTVTENIVYTQTSLPHDAVIRAAQQAAAHEFIQKLDNGYDTRVGEMGSKLSGGQKQRLAIARAILKNAPILLLDEATSALDTESEKLVTEALSHLQENRTTLVVAHRLSTIRDADQIIVLSAGHVLSSGTHEELMAETGGLYPSLYATMTTA